MGKRKLTNQSSESDKEQDFSDLQSILAKDRIIFLDYEIDMEISSVIVSMLHILDSKNHEPISLWINSPGGLVQGFFAIFDMINHIKSPVKTVCIGEASSAAAILLAAGEPGERYVMPHSRVMIHQIQVDGMGGSGTEVEIGTKELKKLKADLTEILARLTGQPLLKIRRDTDRDKYLNSQEAIEYGLADKIYPMTKKVSELVKSKINT